jgi:tyrosyl-tRNA synthetase
MSHTVIATLRDRGLFDAVTSPDIERLVETPTAVYAGFDPSAPSLQVGNFVTIMALAHFQRAGHRVIALVGGATGMIGDPSGKTTARTMLTAEQILRNQEGVRENLSRFLDFDDPKSGAVLVNNHDWFQNFTVVDFLRDVGVHFRVGTMLGKESVRSRLESEAGLSFTEFSYQLLQGYDFLRLHDAHGCRVQIGGSDQWGNITAGTDLIRKLRGVECFGLTFPLVCDSQGQKFGKSEGNAVYLDRRMTPCYDFYQFFLRVEDADVIRFLRIFTFVPLEEIAALDAEQRAASENRTAQRRLAEEVTRTVHGPDGLRVAQQATAVLFGEAMDGLRADDLLRVFANVPSAALLRGDVAGASVLDVAVKSGLCKSKGEARRLVESGGLYLNNRRVASVAASVGEGDVIEGRLLIFRTGKRNFLLVKVA